MSCPTCEHTMQSLGYADGGTIWHCPRCGTVSHPDNFVDAPPRVYVPALVARCHDYAHQAIGRITEQHPQIWRRTGVQESIGKASSSGKKLSSCDCCGEMVDEVSFCIAAGGVETYACEKCRNPEY